MSNKLDEYRVGPGKPPLHSRFRKGQSGNPGGRPGPVKSFRAQLKLALEAALSQETFQLAISEPRMPLDQLVKNLVVPAAKGSSDSAKILFALMEKLEDGPESANHPDADERGTSSLLQGESQGGFEKPGPAEDEAVAKQDVGWPDKYLSGR